MGGGTGAGSSQNIFPITIDYSQSLDEVIKAGIYDRWDDTIAAENFPITGEGKVTFQLVLFHVNRSIRGEDAIKEMTQMELEPAKIEHLLAYGALAWRRDPELVVALGSVWSDPRGRRCVPYLDGLCGNRRLSLAWWAGGWDGRWRFLAVRKS
jgi:hypothetical protein